MFNDQQDGNQKQTKASFSVNKDDVGVIELEYRQEQVSDPEEQVNRNSAQQRQES